MPQLDLTGFSPQIFWLIVVFLCLWWLMAKFALPRVSLVLEERQSRINDSLNTANDLQQKAAAELEAYEKSISEARENARTIINDAKQQGIQYNLTRQSETRDSLTKKISEVEAKIESAKELAIKNIHQTVKEVAGVALDKLVGIGIAEEKLNITIDKLLEKDKQ